MNSSSVIELVKNRRLDRRTMRALIKTARQRLSAKFISRSGRKKPMQIKHISYLKSRLKQYT